MPFLSEASQSRVMLVDLVCIDVFPRLKQDTFWRTEAQKLSVTTHWRATKLYLLFEFLKKWPDLKAEICLIPKVTCSVSVLFSPWCIFHCVRTWWVADTAKATGEGSIGNLFENSYYVWSTYFLTRQFLLPFTCQNATRSGFESQSEVNVFRECIHHKCDCNARPIGLDWTVQWSGWTLPVAQPCQTSGRLTHWSAAERRVAVN